MEQNCRVGKIKHFDSYVDNYAFLEKYLDREALKVAHNPKGSLADLQKICKIISIYKKENIL